MSKQQQQFEANMMVIIDFIEANWQVFESHCGEHEEDSEKIFKELKKSANELY